MAVLQSSSFQFSVSLIERTHWEQITSTANPLQCFIGQEAFQSLLSSKYPNAVMFQKNDSLAPSQAIMFWVYEVRKQATEKSSGKSHPSNLLLMILPVAHVYQTQDDRDAAGMGKLSSNQASLHQPIHMNTAITSISYSEKQTHHEYDFLCGGDTIVGQVVGCVPLHNMNAIRDNPVPIDKLVLQAKSKEAFVEQPEVIKQLQALILGDPQILRKGISLKFFLPSISHGQEKLPLEYCVLECYPNFQGVLATTSSVFIVASKVPTQTETTQTELKLPNGHPPSSPSKGNDSSRTVKEANARIQPLYMSSSFLPTFPLDSSGALDTSSLLTSLGSSFLWGSSLGGNASALNLTVHVTPKLLDHITQTSLFDSIANSKRTYDFSIDTFLDISVLKQLQLFDRSWYQITTKNSTTGQKDTRFVRANALTKHDKELESSVIYMSSLLFFNLQVDETSDVELSPVPGGKVAVSTVQNEEFPCEIATQVTVSRVRSPVVDTNDRTFRVASYVGNLRQYFSSPRVIKEGDLIKIPVKAGSSIIPKFEIEDSEDDAPSQEDLASNWKYFINTDFHHSNNIDYVYFRVSQISFSPPSKDSNQLPKQGIQSSQGVVCHSVSTLFQHGAVESRLPVEYSLVPTDISSTYQAVRSLVEVTLHPKLQQSLGSHAMRFLSILLHSPVRGCGKRTAVQYVANHLGMNIRQVNCYSLLGQIESHTEQNFREMFTETVTKCLPCILVLNNVHVLEKSAQQTHPLKEPRSILSNVLKDCMVAFQQERTVFPLVIVGVTHNIDGVSAALRACFRHEIKVDVPAQVQREAYLATLLHGLPYSKDVSLKELSLTTASFSRKDIHHMFLRATENAIARISKHNLNPHLVATIGRPAICWEDFEEAVNTMKQSQRTAIGAPKVPKVTWKDIGGLANVKQEIIDTIDLPLKSPHLFSQGLRSRSGVLLYGPPGTGKTLIAKAVANEFSLNFLSVKGPELINMYVGESEKNVRDLFQKARAARPCVIFFDELDSLAPNRGKGADSGGVMDRIVSQLLAELSGIQQSSDVFVIGATNRPDLIDPGLLRPGRFDRLVYLGIAEDHQSQAQILKALTRKFNLGSVDIDKIAEECPLNLTGADLYALCSDAMLCAISDTIELLEMKGKDNNNNNGKQQHDEIVIVEQHHFERALKRLSPSVSEGELRHYKQIQSSFQNKK